MHAFERPKIPFLRHPTTRVETALHAIRLIWASQRPTQLPSLAQAEVRTPKNRSAPRPDLCADAKPKTTREQREAAGPDAPLGEGESACNRSIQPQSIVETVHGDI